VGKSGLLMMKRLFGAVFLVTALLAVEGCGGGSSPPPPPPPPAADFSLSVASPSVELQQGGAFESEAVQANPVNGFTGTIQFTLSGLPAGVAGTPSGPYALSISTNTSQQVGFQMNASPSAAVATTTITLTGTSGSITHSVTFSVSVSQAAPWAIQVTPPSLSLTPGTSATVTVSVTSAAPNPPQLSVILPGVNLNGINITEPQGFLTPTNPISFIINPTPQAQPLTRYPYVITVSDDASNTEIYTLPLTVTLPFGANTTPTRSTFVRTDTSPTGMVYDEARQLVFVSVELLNEVLVLSSVDGHQVASIPVNYPAGIDESADGTAVYVVSPLFSGITIIDPNLFEVVGQANVPASVSGTTMGPAFFQVAALSNGQVLLLEATGDTGPVPFFLWDPATNDFTVFGQSTFTPFAGLMSRSADRSKVLGFAGVSGGAVVYDVSTGTTIGPNSSIGAYSAISPDGSQIISVGLQNSPTVFYDGNLNPIASVQLDAFPLTGVAYSLDGRHAYVFTQQIDAYGGNIAAVIDTSTFSVVGIVPGFAFTASLPFSGQWITTFAVDETGMLFGAAGQGVGFLDMTNPTSLGYPLPQWFTVQPTLASLTAPASAQLNGAGFAQNFNYGVYVGAPPASSQTLPATNISVLSLNSVNLTIPEGRTAGPANVTLTRSDGFFEVMPDAVSFGPSILRVDANAGSTSGGDTIKIWGYGFDSGNPQVTIGGGSANISRVTSPIEGTLLPTESITLQTPPGVAGNADVVVRSASGSATVTGGYQYLNSVQVYPMSGSLADIAYDQARKRLYVSNASANQVEIFDLTSNTFLSPVSVGNFPTSLALTPDGTLLAVVNGNVGTVSVINLATLQVTATYPALTASDNSVGCGGVAGEMAPGAPHLVLVGVYCVNTLGGGNMHILNLDTGSLSCSGIAGCGTNGTDFTVGNSLMASTPDGTKIFLVFGLGADDQTAALLNLTTNTLTIGFSNGGLQDAAASADGTIFATSFETANPQVVPISMMAFEAYTDAGGQSFNNLVGERLNPAGSLLFAPQVSGVDLFDVHTGRLALHVVLPDQLPPVVHSMVLDETGTKMFLISSTGVTVAVLNQVPLGLATVNPPAGPSGTTVTLRGSGFQSGATVTFGTSQVAATFVDPNTLQVVVPALASGPVRITVTNPNGKQYIFDDAFGVN